ncbi:MAG: hypothetical protein RBS57_17155, partial [Desulforhabdus sp.]|nr:hypothetical protein [Desulforhabdus sp.]
MITRLAKKTITFLKLLLSSFLGWVLLAPLSLVIPKTNLVLFVEQTPHRFYDNVKYLNLHLCRHPLANGKAIYLTRSETLRDELTKCGLPVFMEDSLRGKWMMLRA